MNKKSLLSLMALLLVSSGLWAQGLHVGVKAGYNLVKPRIEGDNFSYTLKDKNGFHAGAYANIMLTKGFGIQPELLYSRQGSKYQDGAGNTVEEKTDYLLVPALLRFQTNRFLHLNIGPQFNFLFNDVKNKKLTSINKDDFNKADVGLVLGAGLDLPLGLSLEGRYVLGLGNVKKLQDSNGGSYDLKNNIWMVSVSYSLIGFGK